jgi:hypothetical protein
MAEGDGVLYNNYKGLVLSGEIQLMADSIRVILVTGYTPDIDAHTGYSDVSGFEITENDYDDGGQTISGETITVDNSSDRAVYDGYNLEWNDIGPLAPDDPEHAILLDWDHPDQPLIGYWELETPTNGGNYIIQFSTNGILVFT